MTSVHSRQDLSFPGWRRLANWVATKELRVLRHSYKTAYTSYMHCVQALSDANEKGLWPPAETLRLEADALQELNSARQALLAALYAHSMKAPPATTE